MNSPISLKEQAVAVELEYIGRLEWVRRALAKEFKRSDEEVERKRQSLAKLDAAFHTLKALAPFEDELRLFLQERRGGK